MSVSLPDRLTDADLMCRLGRGDSGAFDLLYKRHGGVAFGLAYRIVRDFATAEEVVQDAFVTVWRDSLSYRPERGSARSWMLGIVHNRAIDTLRVKLRTQRGQLMAEHLHERQPAGDLTESELIGRAAARTTWEQLHSLPRAQQEVIKLAFLDDLTYGEIAQTLELPLGTVKGRMRLGLEKLRRSLDSPARLDELVA